MSYEIKNLGLVRTNYCPNCQTQAMKIEQLEAALKRIAAGWPKPMQLARETLAQK